MPEIFSTHNLHPDAVAMLQELGDLSFASAADPDTLLREASRAEILIVRAPLPAALFEQNARLRAAIRHGAGLDMIPMQAANRAGVLVANTPGVNARAVAEYVFFAAMTLLRRFRIVDRDLRTQGWNVARRQADHTRELDGLTMGIVGFGNIGRKVCDMAVHGFGLDVAIHSRSRKEVPSGATFVELDELAARADIVALCCPLTDETRGLVNERFIGLMKPGALVVNISRGLVIDDAAMIAALRRNRIGGAALDVFANQPLPPDHPYLSFENVIVTPHMAGITEGSMRRMGVGAAEEAARVVAGELPLNFCNPEVLESYRRRFPATK